jgi:hypothetical protein
MKEIIINFKTWEVDGLDYKFPAPMKFKDNSEFLKLVSDVYFLEAFKSYNNK